ncbi:MAG: tRNA (N6-isopentenyl adenosine(37)-C2)-methylthiotransferase MiaB [Lachnospiraceae bacterium]|nr:tRNA (N6-isopentenyl adenosine(37)-C2)-methylthiotransferase MiaB [Lachnospiraceae bacterium]
MAIMNIDENLEAILEKIDTNETVPESEPERQYYYIKLLRKLISDRSTALGRPLTACVQTFGCQMNAKDSEKLLGILTAAGFEETESEAADFVLYNTCTVRDNANQRVYGRLGYLNALKKENRNMIIAICGCMTQEPSVVEKLKKSYRFIDIIFGTHNIFQLAELLYERMTADEMVVNVWDGTDKIVEELPAVRKYPFKSGVNIMYGCNNFCTYCIVPYVRGRERSRRPEEIINEIKRLVGEGVKEVMLLGQNVNSYGKTLDEPVSFAQLLKMVEQIEGLERIRFMTSHPKDLSDELIEVMKNSKKICRHLHLPLQSGSSRILKAMNRRYDKEKYLALARKIKSEIPDISLTTDIIVGFPGETEEDFLETMDVVEKVRYDSAFTFIYSKRTGTPAAAMEQVPEEDVKDRFNRLLDRVQKISAEVCTKDTGKVMSALVEGVDSHDSSMVTGRLSNNIMVHFKGDASLIGEIVDVRLDEAKGFYYIGSRV